MNQETGAKEAISYRCTDIDRLVPQLMGVSKVSMPSLPLRPVFNSAQILSTSSMMTCLYARHSDITPVWHFPLCP